MPKRYGKAKREFLSGAFFGRNAAYLGIQIEYQRERQGKTIEEFAEMCGITPARLRRLENADIITHLQTDLKELMHIANVCDIALSVKFAAMNDLPPVELAVPFREEDLVLRAQEKKEGKPSLSYSIET